LKKYTDTEYATSISASSFLIQVRA